MMSVSSGNDDDLKNTNDDKCDEDDGIFLFTVKKMRKIVGKWREL